MMMPQFDINGNKLFQGLSIISTAAISYFVEDQNLRAALVLGINTLMGGVSVKAQTLNPDGSKIDKVVGEKENENEGTGQTESGNEQADQRGGY